MLARIMNNSSKPSSSHQLDELIDVDRDIEIFKQNKLKLLNPQVLYNTGFFSSTAHLYRHYREEQLSVSEDDSENINLISKESMQEIQKRRMNLMHMGLVVIGLKGLTRKNLGTKVLITLYDSRWSESKRSIIGLTEVDMSNNGGIFYCSPDFMINSKEFGKYIKIGIQTKGYEEINCGNNLLVCVGFIGKLATNSSSRFKIK